MTYSCYKDAFDALVQGNDGILPDLYEDTDFTIFTYENTTVVSPTVADVVAHALIEASREHRAAATLPRPAPALPLPVRRPAAHLAAFKDLIGQTVASLN